MEWGKFFTDLLAAIPSNPVLRDHVALAQERVKHLEAQNRELERQLKEEKDQTALLRKHIEDHVRIPDDEQPEVMYGCYYFKGDRSRLYCPGCYDRDKKKCLVSHIRHHGHKCSVCQNIVPG